MTEAAEDTSTGLRIGYARCSTEKQDLRAQKAELDKLGPDQVFTDEGFSGTKRDSRTGLDQALAALRAGDTLIVTKLDRLARSVPDARSIAEEVQAKGARIQIGSMVYDPLDPMGKMFFNMLATFAEFEADIARMRTREGMAEARRAGKLKGKQPTFSKRQDTEVRRMRNSGDYTIGEIAELFSTTRPTIYRSLARTDPLAATPAETEPSAGGLTATSSHPAQEPAPAASAAAPEQQPARPSPQTRRASTPPGARSRSKRSPRRRYTNAELDDYQLDKVRDESGEILEYRVLVAGDTLGTIARAPYRHQGWVARTSTRIALPHRGGTGRQYARNQQEAVIDLLLGLDITSSDQ